MFPFRAGECDLLWASGVEGAVLLAEAVLEEDLKRLRLRCWLKCGRGMLGQRSRHRLLLRARGCLVFGRLLAAGMIETGPPIAVIGGVQRAAVASKSAMPSGKPSTISLRYGSDGSSGVWHRQADEAGLSGQRWVVEGRLAVQCGCRGWESRKLRMRMRYKVCNEYCSRYGGVSRLMGRHTPKHPRRLVGKQRCGEGR